jgi:hypothetical protein
MALVCLAMEPDSNDSIVVGDAVVDAVDAVDAVDVDAVGAVDADGFCQNLVRTTDRMRQNTGSN